MRNNDGKLEGMRLSLWRNVTFLTLDLLNPSASDRYQIVRGFQRSNTASMSRKKLLLKKENKTNPAALNVNDDMWSAMCLNSGVSSCRLISSLFLRSSSSSSFSSSRLLFSSSRLSRSSFLQISNLEFGAKI